MPNWCSNRVRVCLKEGDNVEDMKEFKTFVSKDFSGSDKDGPWTRHQPFSFEAILPMPKELELVMSPVSIVDTLAEVHAHREKNKGTAFYSGSPITQEISDRLDEDYGANNWHDWTCENWGVKWDCSNVQLTEEFGDLELCYTFDTPWGPPEEIYIFLVAKFPKLSFSWFWDEPGMELAGYLK